MSSAPCAAQFPLEAMRPARECAPHLPAVFAGASLGLLLAQVILSGALLTGLLENGTMAPHLASEIALSLPRPSDGAAAALSLALSLIGALAGRLLPWTDKPRRVLAKPAGNEVLRSWVRAGDLVELQFASGSWVLVRAQVNDRQWRDVQRLLVWSRRMARGDAN